MKRPVFLIISRSIRFSMRNVSDKSVEKIKKTQFVFNNPLKSHRL